MREQILQVLIDACLRGGAEILAVRGEGGVATEYKSGVELFTTADTRSDAAMRAVFEARLPGIDPAIGIELEESGATGGGAARKQVGADPLDGTNHFASGGHFYSVQAYYSEDGVPVCGVVFQPEVFLPLVETPQCLGRLVYATAGRGAFVERTVYRDGGFERGEQRRVVRQPLPPTKGFAACVPFGSKLTEEERALVHRVYDAGLVAVSTGMGGAGANVLLTIFGGQHVYANFGAGDILDLAPPQVIALEAGMTVWGMDRRAPVWDRRKQPFIVAPSDEIAERFLVAAGL